MESCVSKTIGNSEPLELEGVPVFYMCIKKATINHLHKMCKWFIIAQKEHFD